MMLDLSAMYAELYERAIWTLCEIDHGVHGSVGLKARVLIEEEVAHLKGVAFGDPDAGSTKQKYAAR